MSRLALLCLLAFSACGADGVPTPPAAQPVTNPNVAISGDVRVGATTSF
jgi:hypothetical protein